MKHLASMMHATRISVRSSARAANLGKPNVFIDLPAGNGLSLAADSHALYVALSSSALGRSVARNDSTLQRLIARKHYPLLVLDLRLVQNADRSGLRWLGGLKRDAARLNTTLHVRSSGPLKLVLQLAGWRLENAETLILNP